MNEENKKQYVVIVPMATWRIIPFYFWHPNKVLLNLFLLMNMVESRAVQEMASIHDGIWGTANGAFSC